jgi:mannosyltransferase
LALLDSAGLWRDEIPSLTTARWPLAEIFTARFGDIRNQPPLHYLLIDASWSLLGPPGGPLSAEAAARLPFALIGALTCLLVAVHGRRLFGTAAGLVGGALLAVSFGHLAQSVEARPYALLTGCVLAAFAALDRALDGGPRAGRWWAAAVGAALLGVASSYLMVYAVLPGLALVAAGRLWPTLRAALRGPTGPARRQLALPVGAGLALAVGRLPAIPEMLSFSWASKAQPDNPLDAVVKLLLYNGLTFGPAPGALWAAGLALAALGGAGWAWRSGPRGRQGVIGLGILLGWGLIALSLSGSSELVAPRYWSYSYPLLCLLAGAGLASLIGWAGRRAPAVRSMVAAALLVAAFSGAPGVVAALAAQEVPPGAPVRPDYRAAARLLAALARPGDLIAVLDEPENGWRVCDWYWRSGVALAPGVQVTDSADARLGDLAAPRQIYWLLATDDPGDLARIAGGPPPGTQVVGQAERVLILREAKPDGAAPAARLTALVQAIAASAPGPLPRYLAVALGNAAQAQGDFAAALRWDQQAGTYRPLGAEHLANATGWVGRGAPDRALIDIAAARSLEPPNATIHLHAAALLDQIAYGPAAQRERRLAALLPP